MRILRLLLVSLLCSSCSLWVPTSEPDSMPRESMDTTSLKVASKGIPVGGFQALVANGQGQSLLTPKTLHDFQFLHLQTNLLPFNSSQELAHFFSDADVILFGEYHEHPALHHAQLRLLQGLHDQKNGDPWLLSMELFSRDQQVLVDQYLNDQISESSLRKKSSISSAYFSSYRSLLTYAKNHHIPIIAANAPRSVVRCIGQLGDEGWEQIPQSMRSWVRKPVAIKNEQSYQQRFAEFMQGLDEQQVQNSFAAQQVWDATMAWSIVSAKQQHPEHKIMHTVGTFHVSQLGGLVRRIKHWQPELNVIVISPVERESLDQIQSQQEFDRLNEAFVLVDPLPPQWLPSELEKISHHSHSHRAENVSCKF